MMQGLLVSPPPPKFPILDETEQRRRFIEEVLAHEPKLRRFVERVGKGQVDVDDLVQDTLARLISTPQWRTVARPTAFMYATARHLMIDAQRRRRVVAEEATGPTEMAVFPDDQADPEAVAIARDDLRRLATVVAGLPPRQKAVFIMRRIQGLELREIAERLGISVFTVERHLTLALRNCAERLAKGR